MHPPHVRAKALELIAAGKNDCEVSRIRGPPPNDHGLAPAALCPKDSGTARALAS